MGSVNRATGFLPDQPPTLAMPASHQAWDEIAATLPSLWRDVTARKELLELPTLPAGEEDLADEHLWRASVVLGALAYCYVRCDIHDLHLPAPVAVPGCILGPWSEVAHRMGRRQPNLEYDDLVTHNWRLRDPRGPVRLENLDSLVPQTGSDTERAFLLINVEIQAQCAPMVEAAVAAQEAAQRDDRHALTEALLVMLDRLRHVTEVSFPKIDPNPYGHTCADPAVWAKLVAPTGIPIVSGVPGVSGAGASALQMVDAFLGRTKFESSLGGEGKAVRARFAPNVRRFLDAIEEVSVRDYVEQSDDRGLQGLFQAVRDAYAGPHGYLGIHKRKVYGFIQVAFKVGRPSTASGISGFFRDRAWRETTEQLEASRRERYWEGSVFAPYGTLELREPASAQRAGVQHVVLDVAGAGMVFQTGDRCGVLPVNNAALVERTLEALRARGGEGIPVGRAWQEALVARLGPGAPAELELADFLRFAKLRPLVRSVGKALARLSSSHGLDDLLEQRLEDTCELWDALDLMTANGYDVTRLWHAELWQDEALARIVPPEDFRMYSLSAPPDNAPFSDHLHLTVGPLRFKAGDAERRGTASTFLREDAEPGDRVPVRVVRPLRFRLPVDASRPVVMFAGGTGMSPFHGFLQDRLANPHSGPTWLFAGTRTEAELCYAGELAAWEAEGKLIVRTAFSRGDPRRRIGEVMKAPANATTLREYLTPEEGAYFYVCGQAGFAASVLDTLRDVAGEDGRQVVRRLLGGGRFMQDIFTTFAPATAPGVAGADIYDASELVLHNDAAHGWWTAVNGAVYDMTEFRHLHPGGYRIIDDNAGLDATAEYQAVLHHQDSEIEAMLAMYKIGFIRRLDFARQWGIAITRKGIDYMALQDVYRAWARHLFLVVELENSLGNDFAVLDQSLTVADGAARFTPLKMQLLFDTQARFMNELRGGPAGDVLAELWAVVASLADPDEQAWRLARHLDDAFNRGATRRACLQEHLLANGTSQAGVGGLDADRCAELLAAVRDADRRVLAAIKASLREGVMVFEQLEADAVRGGGRRLLDSLAQIPGALDGFHADIDQVPAG
ncbi:MAG: cytochrome b5 domain-containing protein [Acidimicrobiales bacterium]